MSQKCIVLLILYVIPLKYPQETYKRNLYKKVVQVSCVTWFWCKFMHANSRTKLHGIVTCSIRCKKTSTRKTCTRRHVRHAHFGASLLEQVFCTSLFSVNQSIMICIYVYTCTCTGSHILWCSCVVLSLVLKLLLIDLGLLVQFAVEFAARLSSLSSTESSHFQTSAEDNIFLRNIDEMYSAQSAARILETFWECAV